MPLIAVAALFPSVLTTTTADKDKAGRFGFRTSGAIGTAAALFFVVMPAHIQLCEQFAGSAIAHLEHLYLTIYVAILLASLNIYLFSSGYTRGRLALINYNDNLIPKVAFWPVLLGVLTIITSPYF